MKNTLVCVGVLSFLYANSAFALDINTIEKIAATTRSMCLSGSQYDLQANADGSLSLLKLSPGGEGKIRITQSTGTGGALNYKDEGKRVDADKNILGCISQNVPVLLAAAGASLAAAPAPKACRSPSHGIEKYQKEFNTSQSSNWMGGGYSRDRWCNDVINSLRGQYSAAEFTVIGTDERSESKCKPFNCPQYQYTCTIHVKTDPLYVEKTSSACQ